MIIALGGPVMPYAWGSRFALAHLLGREPTGQPEAELWVGAHPLGPARLVEPVGEAQDLEQLLAQDPARLLGADLALRYGRLPFLLKVLAIDQPLSLQAHPNAEQAREGFEREELSGLARGHGRRSYRDDQHKPELLFALSPVEVLCGFRPPSEVTELLSTFGLANVDSPLAQASAAFPQAGDEQGYEALFRSFFELSSEALARALDLVLARAGREVSSRRENVAGLAKWLLRLSATYGSDPGLLAVLLLRLVQLEPGQALFLPARRLHAYLSGLGVEVMAASDNVLRGGLTPKHVDVDELCRVLDFSPSMPDLVVPTDAGEEGVRVFRTPAEEFELWSARLDASAPAVSLPSPCVLLVLEGELEVTQGSDRGSFGRGEQAFVSFSLDPARVAGTGRFFVASVRA